MTNDPTGGPAFPVPATYFPNGNVQYGESGMTLRDWYVGKALEGLCANPKYFEQLCVSTDAKQERLNLAIVYHANAIADEAMRQREGK